MIGSAAVGGRVELVAARRFGSIGLWPDCGAKLGNFLDGGSLRHARSARRRFALRLIRQRGRGSGAAGSTGFAGGFGDAFGCDLGSDLGSGAGLARRSNRRRMRAGREQEQGGEW